ncbi:MAG TPA: DUF4845 domain-containing protein [Dokdonella sp.]|uniref:DUF4845 domain-containing protein n=1 Tax=Dokdonella sp. TaxID=2291710 RepID=UPI002D7EF05D|nr:DUF4845 domain-containing protein [Dokdonella sp.]HET9032520.1 DUF4845 domain-containing protein [Dokdonella sp.]
MWNRKRTSGITLIGFLMLLCVIGFFGYMAMRLVPMTVEYMGVVKAMEQVKTEPNAQNMSPEEIRNSLYRKFDTQYVDDSAIPPQSIQILKKNNGTTLRITYERRVSFIHNIDLIGSFDKSVSLSGGDGG